MFFINPGKNVYNYINLNGLLYNTIRIHLFSFKKFQYFLILFIIIYYIKILFCTTIISLKLLKWISLWKVKSFTFKNWALFQDWLNFYSKDFTPKSLKR